MKDLPTIHAKQKSFSICVVMKYTLQEYTATSKINFNLVTFDKSFYVEKIA